MGILAGSCVHGTDEHGEIGGKTLDRERRNVNSVGKDSVADLRGLVGLRSEIPWDSLQRVSTPTKKY